MTTRADAYEDMRQMVFTDWKALARYNGAVPEMRFQGQEKAELPPSTAAWARFSIQENGSYQRTFGDTSNRRFERYGVLSTQIFVPTADGRHLSEADVLATIARNSFEGKTSPHGVWFRNATIREIGVDGAWWNINASAMFSYDEIK